MRLTSLFVFFILSVLFFDCSHSPKEEGVTDFETVEKNESFRNQVKTGGFVKLSEGFTYYELENRDADTVVVLVHGFSVPSYIWDSTYQASLANHYGTLRYDLFGRGYSDNPDVVYDAALFANQLRELLDALSINGKINLVGLSYGGRVISAFASQYPDRIQNLVYVDPAGFETITEAKEYPVFVTEEQVADFKSSDYYAGMAGGQLYDFYDSTRFRGWDKQYQEMMKFKGLVRALLSTRENASSMEAEHKKIGEAAYPVYAIWGKYDTVVPLDSVRTNLNERIPRLELIEIPDAGHLPHMEQTPLFNKLLFDKIIRNKTEMIQ